MGFVYEINHSENAAVNLEHTYSSIVYEQTILKVIYFKSSQIIDKIG